MGMGRRLVVIGATSAIAVACTRIWAGRNVGSIVLVGRDSQKLADVTADLLVRNPSLELQSKQTDFLSASAISTLVDDICGTAMPDLVLIAHGNLPDQSACQGNIAGIVEAIHINGLSPVLFAEAFISHMQRSGKGNLCMIGSVAGDRGRKSNYVYGSAKALLSNYAEGLQHRLSGSEIRVTLVKPGPTDTPMTAAFKNKGMKLAPVELVARCIVSAVEAGKPVVYAPAKWWVIMMVIRHLPRWIFNKLDI